MNFWSIGLDHKTASLDDRVKASLNQAGFLDELLNGLDESVCISTCNRVEIYAISEESPDSVLIKWLEKSGLPIEKKEVFRLYLGREALNHLFRVTASLESMVLGESQISGQVKKAYQEAVDGQRVGKNLHPFFQAAFKTAKKIRSETEVGQFSVSMPSVGVKLAERIMGNLNHHKVGVIGLGEIGRVAAEHFGSVGPKKLFLFNRNRKLAEEFDEKMKAEGIASEVLDSVSAILEKSDVIVSAVNVEIIERSHLESLKEEMGSKFILDLSVPRSVAPYEADHLYIYEVDDLKKIAEENTQLRQQELERADQIVFEEVNKSWRQIEAISVAETFESLKAKVEDLQSKELKLLRQRLPDLSQKDWQEIEKMTSRLGSKILQDPIVELKSRMEQAEERETWLQFFRNIFRI